MKDFLKSLSKSFKQALSENEYFVRFSDRHPKLIKFLKQRLSLSGPYGLFSTIGFGISILLFVYFLSIVQDVLTRDSFVEADIRMMNLITALRSIRISKILLLFTYLANWQVVVTLGLLAVIILGLFRQRKKIMLFVGGILGGELVGALFKLLLHRNRPNPEFSVLTTNGYAFPSGHAIMASVFYGLIGYFIYKSVKNIWGKIAIILFFLGLIFLIGLSRIYLGVHWSSDVAAGWIIGFSLLAFLITYFEQSEKFSQKQPVKSAGIFSQKIIASVIVFLLVAEGVFIYSFYQGHPLKTANLPATTAIININSPESVGGLVPRDDFPKFSENIIGEKMEPMGFIIVGSKDALKEIFKSAGWLIADGLRPTTVYNTMVAALFNRQYLNAPVTPSFLNAQPENITFEKPTEANTVRQRHHIRFWATNFQINRLPIWVGTASFDDGLRYLITHKIRPDIDTERDFIKDELAGTGLAGDIRQIRLVKPLMGKNQSADPFFTDGKAYLIFLK